MPTSSAVVDLREPAAVAAGRALFLLDVRGRLLQALVGDGFGDLHSGLLPCGLRHRRSRAMSRARIGRATPRVS